MSVINSLWLRSRCKHSTSASATQCGSPRNPAQLGEGFSSVGHDELARCHSLGDVAGMAGTTSRHKIVVVGGPCNVDARGMEVPSDKMDDAS